MGGMSSLRQSTTHHHQPWFIASTNMGQNFCADTKVLAVEMYVQDLVQFVAKPGLLLAFLVHQVTNVVATLARLQEASAAKARWAV